jgi:hypothetical protein
MGRIRRHSFPLGRSLPGLRHVPRRRQYHSAFASAPASVALNADAGALHPAFHAPASGTDPSPGAGISPSQCTEFEPEAGDEIWRELCSACLREGLPARFAVQDGLCARHLARREGGAAD